MTRYPPKTQYKLGLNGVTRNELVKYSREVLEASKTPLTTRQIADLIKLKQGNEVNLRMLGHVLGRDIPMIQKYRKRITSSKVVTFYLLPQTFNKSVVEAKG